MKGDLSVPLHHICIPKEEVMKEDVEQYGVATTRWHETYTLHLI